MTNNIVSRPFTPDQWSELKFLNIAKVTKRGRRGGKKSKLSKRLNGNQSKQSEQFIQTRVTNRSSTRQLSTSWSATSNAKNLIRIKKSNPHVPSSVNFALWNAHSLRAKRRAKMAAVIDLVISNHIHILAVTESWLTGDQRDNRVLADLKNALPHFDLHHIPRKKRGGGVAVLLRKGFNIVSNTSVTSFKTFEHMDLTISSKSSSIRLIVVYRPPPSKANELTKKGFFEEFERLVEILSSLATPYVIAGDFNFHMDNCDDYNAKLMSELLESASMVQHVSGPTHTKGHTLDLVITRDSDTLVSNVKTDSSLPSDHSAIKCELAISGPPVTCKEIRFRKVRNVNIESFKEDIRNSPLVTDPITDDVEALSSQFDSVLRELLDKHAPETTRCVTLRPHAPWYDDAIRDQKRERCRCERQYLKSGLEVHKQIYKTECKKYLELIDNAKSKHHESQFQNCDQKQLFKAVDKLCSGSSEKILPSHVDAEQLANDFATFFEDKIKKVRDKLDNINLPSTPSENTYSQVSASSLLENFSEVCEDIIRDIIKKSPSSSCSQDAIPTWLLKECLGELLPSITRIVNLSFLSGIFPTSYKISHVTTLIKKANLDADCLSNYRPIANLKFVSKVVERVASSQLQKYLEENDLYGKKQSAYRKCFSTETALVRVQNDILRALDHRNDVLFVLLDLSAAFDTVDHQVLLKRLRDDFGVCESALKWCASYLIGRKQSVVIGSSISRPHDMDCSVPQGSVAGRFMFTIYASPLKRIIRSFGVDCMIYADDTQLYLLLDSTNRDSQLQKHETCIRGIKAWTAENKLLLNDAKTEVLHILSRFLKELNPIPSVCVGQEDVVPSTQVRNLGAIMDQHMTSASHVNRVCQSASLAIVKIGSIRKYIDRTTAERLVHAFVTSRLDANNSLMYGIPNASIRKLQRVQNSAVRLVLGV